MEVNMRPAAPPALSTDTPVVPPAAGRPASPDGSSQPAGGKDMPPAAVQPATSESIAEAIARIQDYLRQNRRELQFDVDESSGRTVIRVTNPENGQLVRQIPAEEVLHMAAFIEARVPHLFDDSV